MIKFVLVPLLAAAGFAAPNSNALSTLGDLEKKSRDRVSSQARVTLLPDDSPALQGATLLEAGRVPNYLRALGHVPNAIKPFATLIKTALYDGAVAPEIKMAMGLRVAQVHGSPYVAIHMQRLLVSTGQSARITKAAANSPEALAVEFAELLTRDVHGVKDADFRRVSSAFNDSQVVELTMTTCFFNYFTRMAEGLNLPVESWALEPAKVAAPSGYAKPEARVAIVSDVQAEAVAKALATIKENQANPNGLGLGFANSQRAMLLSPAFGAAWRAYGTAVREYSAVNRETKLHVSFAVSMANGCRYCTIHQVLGLKRLNVSPTKLMQMKKDDSALTPRELAAVLFARKLTAEPSSISDTDYAALKKEFGEAGAVEVLLQTCAFAFMNRFTDGLHLPSEDEAIKVYQEIYGTAKL